MQTQPRKMAQPGQTVAFGRLSPGAVALLALGLLLCQLARPIKCQRDGDEGRNSAEDDFDDPGFDDNGYQQPQRDTESSNHNPNSYSAGEARDSDEDDEPDETHVSPRVSQARARGARLEPAGDEAAPSDSQEPAEAPEQRPNNPLAFHRDQQLSQRPPLPYLMAGPPPGEQYQTAYPVMDTPAPVFAEQRFFAQPGLSNLLLTGLSSAGFGSAQQRYRRSASPEDVEDAPTSPEEPRRKKRHASQYLGPVYTYVKTDKHAHFKWGVKHKVGKH